MLIRGRSLLESGARVQRHHTAPQRVDRLLIIRLKDHRPRNAEVAEALLGHLRRHDVERALLGNHPAPDRSRLAMLDNEQRDHLVLVLPPAESIVEMHFRHR